MNRPSNISILILSLCLMIGTACTHQKQSGNSASGETRLSDSIPFKIAQSIFADSVSTPILTTSEEELERHLYYAKTMENDPTIIDWKHEALINVALEKTRLETDIVPLHLVKQDSSLTLYYTVRRGSEERSYSIQPYCGVVFDRKVLEGVSVVRHQMLP